MLLFDPQFLSWLRLFHTRTYRVEIPGKSINGYFYIIVLILEIIIARIINHNLLLSAQYTNDQYGGKGYLPTAYNYFKKTHIVLPAVKYKFSWYEGLKHCILTSVYCWAVSSGVGPRKKYKSRIPPLVLYTIPGFGCISNSGKKLDHIDCTHLWRST